jgi:hypothetical protein
MEGLGDWGPLCINRGRLDDARSICKNLRGAAHNRNPLHCVRRTAAVHTEATQWRVYAVAGASIVRPTQVPPRRDALHSLPCRTQLIPMNHYFSNLSAMTPNDSSGLVSSLRTKTPTPQPAPYHSPRQHHPLAHLTEPHVPLHAATNRTRTHSL